MSGSIEISLLASDLVKDLRVFVNSFMHSPETADLRTLKYCDLRELALEAHMRFVESQFLKTGTTSIDLSDSQPVPQPVNIDGPNSSNANAGGLNHHHRKVLLAAWELIGPDVILDMMLHSAYVGPARVGGRVGERPSVSATTFTGGILSCWRSCLGCLHWRGWRSWRGSLKL